MQQASCDFRGDQHFLPSNKGLGRSGLPSSLIACQVRQSQTLSGDEWFKDGGLGKELAVCFIPFLLVAIVVFVIVRVW